MFDRDNRRLIEEPVNVIVDLKICMCQKSTSLGINQYLIIFSLKVGEDGVN